MNQNNPDQNESPDEEILLYSADVGLDQQDPETENTITGQLTQDHKWKMQRKFIRIYDGKMLRIVEHFLTSSKKYQVQLMHLDPEPEKVWHLNYRLGLVSLLTGSLACLPLNNEASALLQQWTSNTVSIVVLLATISVLAFTLMLFRSKNTLVFVSYYGRNPMVTLLNNKPSKEAFEMFCSALAGNIRQSRQNSLLNKSQMLAAELGELRRLKDESTISESEYNAAKAGIFSHHTDN